MMTRKHFELVAQTLAESCPTEHTLGIKTKAHFEERLATWTITVLNMALALRDAGNPQYDIERFISACGADKHIDCPNVITGKEVNQ